MSGRRRQTIRGEAAPPDAEGAAPGAPAGLPLWALAGTAFFTGFSVLLIEIAGPRLLAPYLGDSLYTWSTTIAVVLGAMALGYIAGGWLSDRRPDARTFFAVVLAGGFLAALVPGLARAALSDDLSKMSPSAGTLRMCLILFAPACLVLAMSWPFAVRLVFESGETLGRRAGIVGSASTLGSIAGAVSGGWWLVPSYGLRVSFWIAAAIPVLIGLAGLVLRAKGGMRPMAGVLAAAALGLAAVPEAAPASDVIHREHTFYHRIDIVEEGPMRYLKLNSTYEGGRDTETGELAFDYLKYWPLMLDPARPPEKLLFLGAGAYSLPGYLYERNPEAEFTVVDIDPRLHDIAALYFDADNIDHLVKVSGDARRFLMNDTNRYDAIFGDTYHGINRVPPHLTTVEYFRLVRERLNPPGRFLVNIIGAREGEGARLPGGVVSALREVFPVVRVFATRTYDSKLPQNLMILASNGPVDMEADSRTAPFVRKEVEWKVQEPAFTDDHAPVDYLSARLIKAWGR